MNAYEFHKVLKETGAYETAPGQVRSLGDRLFGWLDTWYYLRTFLIIFSGYITACRGKFDRQQWTKHAHAILQVVEGCGGRISIHGLDAIAKLETPAVYVANHMSVLETMLLPGAIILPFQNVTTVVKKSLLSYPFFGRIIKALDLISVTRQNPRADFREVLAQGTESLRDGMSVLVFPQATRSFEFDPGSFNTLGIKLAQRAGVAIVPVAVKTDFHGIGPVFKDIGRINRKKTICFKFGEPLMVDGNHREVHKKVVNFIAENLREWGAKVRDEKTV